MRFLAFRKISTGQWTNAVFTTAGDSFAPAETESRRLDIAAALSLPETDLETGEGATDPRDAGPYLELPVEDPGIASTTVPSFPPVGGHRITNLWRRSDSQLEVEYQDIAEV